MNRKKNTLASLFSIAALTIIFLTPASSQAGWGPRMTLTEIEEVIEPEQIIDNLKNARTLACNIAEIKALNQLNRFVDGRRYTILSVAKNILDSDMRLIPAGPDKDTWRFKAKCEVVVSFQLYFR